VNHPSEVVAIGDTVRIKVLDIDRDRQRISLGLKQTQEDPWQRVISTHRPGDVLEGSVTKVVAFGAFVEILPGVEGLVHISELADHHVENPSEVVEPGSTLNVKILEIDEERRRLSLSIKQVEGQNMPMGDLGEQLQAANAEGSDPSAAGPDAEDDSSSSQAAGEEPSSTPPADEAPEAEGSAEVAEDDAPAAEPVAEEPEAEVAAEPEAPAEAEAAETADPAPVAEENGTTEDNGSEDDGGEAQEGETAADRPDSPDSVDEAAGETSEPEAPADS
ncbi:MAG TPA: S1 RNA-binding domain-containing protein, partial [Solirubrobacterales bacterium]|nr:S1 RNA-binding domain-containing protein [Solirubrobacterales bacterium]